PLELAQAGRVFSGPGPTGADRAGAPAAAPARARHLVPADPDLEGIHRSGPGRQAGPDRVRDQRLPGPLLRLRPVRAAVDPALPRRVPGAEIPPRSPAGCRTACAAEMPTPATPACWPPSAANAPASAANASNA